MKKQKKMAVVNDFSGFGRCSLTVAIPIISAMKIQCCAVPTAIFSNHTGYPDYFFDDYTNKMQAYYEKWEKLGLQFDGIYTGFLGSQKQAEIVGDFISRFSGSDTIVTVDPVMGDNGITYATVDKALCRQIKKLLPFSHIITPNLTEACILTDSDYHDVCTERELTVLSEKLHTLGAKNVIITGIACDDKIGNFVSTGTDTCLLWFSKSGTAHAGTGDVFASVIAADAVNGVPLEQSVKKAADFVAKAVALSDEMKIPEQDGVCFEEILDLLM